MKRASIVLVCLLLITGLASCAGTNSGTNDANDAVGRTIRTTSNGDGVVVVTYFMFDEDGVLNGVRQSETFTNEEDAESAAQLISDTADLFCDLSRDGATVNFKMTEKGIDTLYPDSSYESVLNNAKANGMEIVEE